MAAYEYEAISAEGKNQNGLIEADTAKHARQQLRGMGLMPVSINEVTGQASDNEIKSRRDKISVANVALVTRQLATLISAGQPIESAYLAVSRQTNKKPVKKILLAVRSRVLEGHALSDALQEYPRVFDSMYCASVHAGEQSGLLDVVMERLADHMESRQEFQRKTGLALIYPVLLSIVAFGIIGMLMTFVVPKIVQVFEGFDQELPPVTVLLIAISDFFRDYGLSIFIGLVIALIIYGQLLRFESFRAIKDRLVLKIPFISYLVRLSNTARFTRTMSILVGSGVTALDAMRISTQVIESIPINNAVSHAADRVREGEHVSNALEQTSYFSPLVLQLVQNGESSGKLGEMFERSAKAEESEFAGVAAIFVGLFEPAMILIMGLVVLFIVVAILVPIFDMNELV